MNRKHYVLRDLYPSSLGFFPAWSDIASDAEAEFRLRQSGAEGAELKVSEDEEEEEEAEGASHSVTEEGNHFLFSAWIMLIAFEYTAMGFRRRESLGFELSHTFSGKVCACINILRRMFWIH